MKTPNNTDLVHLLIRLRWLIPLGVGLVGVLFIVTNEILMEGRNPFSVSILLTFFTLCIFGPAFAWLTLNWATRAAVSDENTKRELARSTAENERLYQEAQRRALHLETASLVGQRITALLDMNAILDNVVRLAGQKFGYYHTQIFLVDEEAGEIVLRAANGPSGNGSGAVGLRIRIGGQGITAWVARSGQALLCNDVHKEPRFLDLKQMPETKSELAVPLRVGNRVIGVLDVQSNQLNQFDKEDVTILQVLGNQLGTAIENARLFAETRRRYEAMVALHETSLDVISQLDRPKVLNGLLRRGVRLWGALGGNLMLYDPQKGELYSAARYNLPDSYDIRLHPGEGLVGRVFESGEPMMVDDYQHWEGRISDTLVSNVSVFMAAPLKWQDERIGVVLIANDKKMRLFDKNDLWLLTLFADLAMIAIRNAELHTQLKAISRDLESKVEERTLELSVATKEIANKADQLRNLLAHTIHLQEEERARIAREMHDGVIQMVTALRYELKAANVAVSMDNPADASAKLKQARQVLGDMEKEIRHAIYDLHPPALDAVDLIPALRKYTKNFEAVSGIGCNLQVHGQPCRLPSRVEVAIFRIVEQGLQNVVTHAGATETVVNLAFESDVLCLEVQDNGRGFDPDHGWAQNRENHLGLVSMQERVRNLEGTMEIFSQPGGGTQLRFALPLVCENEASLQ